MRWTRIGRVYRFTTDDEFDKAIIMLQESKYGGMYKGYRRIRKCNDWWKLISDVKFEVGEQLIYQVGNTGMPIPDKYCRMIQQITKNLKIIQKDRGF